ncbi:MAG: DUF3307 domain-containing protein [Methylophilaceae bacterium]
MFEALLLLFIKHFICDFPLQAFPWIYNNKGRYLHLGGILHAAIHGVGTLFVLFPFIGSPAFIYAAIDMVVHYHIDWAKMNLSEHYNLKPNSSEWFWVLLGLDQLLHHLTYFAIIYHAYNYTIL